MNGKRKQQRKERETEALQAASYEEIGRLKFELDWLKKTVAPAR